MQLLQSRLEEKPPASIDTPCGLPSFMSHQLPWNAFAVSAAGTARSALTCIALHPRLNVYTVYSLQVNCSKLILNTILRAAPFILQCLHMWMYAATTKTSTTFAGHHSDVKCKHPDTHRRKNNHGQRLIMDKPYSESSALCQLEFFRP